MLSREDVQDWLKKRVREETYPIMDTWIQHQAARVRHADCVAQMEEGEEMTIPEMLIWLRCFVLGHKWTDKYTMGYCYRCRRRM